MLPLQKLCTILLALCSALSPGLAAEKPNIVLILADDLGYGDLSCYGAQDMRTPRLDTLMGQGMRFDRFYANCTVCSPGARKSTILHTPSSLMSA